MRKQLILVWEKQWFFILLPHGQILLFNKENEIQIKPRKVMQNKFKYEDNLKVLAHDTQHYTWQV